jgi:hypothetical protein
MKEKTLIILCFLIAITSLKFAIDVIKDIIEEKKFEREETIRIIKKTNN